MKAFRKLYANEIECRISQISQKGLSLLLYKDARVDQRLLDETVGPLNWQRSHQLIGDRLYCTVSIWDEEKKQWISKQDVGTESYTEKEKGQASDSFKRACFNFGIGRELYTAPFIWVSADACTIQQGQNGKAVCYDRFEVMDIGYDQDGNINRLSIMNTKRNAPAFTMGGAKPVVMKDKPVQTTEAPKAEMINDAQLSVIYELCNQHNIKTAQLVQKYGVPNMRRLTSEQAQEIILNLKGDVA